MKESTTWMAFSILMAMASLTMLVSVLRDLTTGHDMLLLIVHLLGGIICIAGAVLGVLSWKKTQNKVT